jgi:hypothetical protein
MMHKIIQKFQMCVYDFFKKTFQPTSNKGEPAHYKGHLQKSATGIVLSGEKLNNVPSKRKMQEYPVPPPLFILLTYRKR